MTGSIRWQDHVGLRVSKDVGACGSSDAVDWRVPDRGRARRQADVVEFDTTGFNQLLLKENLVEEPGGGEKRRVRKVLFILLLVVVAWTVALAVGVALGTLLSYVQYAESLKEVSEWRVE